MAGTSARARRLTLQILLGMFAVLLGVSCTSAEVTGETNLAAEEPNDREASARERTTDGDAREPDLSAGQGLEAMNMATWLRLPVPPDEWSLEDEFAGGFEFAASSNDIVIAAEASIWGDDWRNDEHFVQNRTEPTMVGLLEGYVQAEAPAVQIPIAPRRLDIQHADEAAMVITSIEAGTEDLYGSDDEDEGPVDGGTPKAASERLTVIEGRAAAVVGDYGFIVIVGWIVEPADADTAIAMVEAMLDGIILDPQALVAAISEETSRAGSDDL